MKRAILVALGTMALVSSATAIRLAGADTARVAEVEAGFRGSEQSARAMQRARIELRYQAQRARCAPLGGAQRDQCLIAAHALKGRALLDSASPYQAGS
jgi:hypothetical protein